MARRTERSPANGRYSDEWLFSDGIDGVEPRLFKPRARAASALKLAIIQAVIETTWMTRGAVIRIQNLQSLILCALHKR
jgi:hypothetical protein